MRIPAIFVTHRGEKVKGYVIGRELMPMSSNHHELIFQVTARKATCYAPRQIIRTSEQFTIPRNAFKVVSRMTGAWIRTRSYSWARYFATDV